MSASVTFPLAAGKTEVVTLSNVDASPAPQWAVQSGQSTVTPSQDGLSASWFGAPAGDVTVVQVTTSQGGVQDVKTLTAQTYDAGTGGGGAVAGPDVSVGSPA